MTDAFQIVADNYRGLAGGKPFFTILLHNVVATIFLLISGVIVGIIPTFAIGANGFILGVVYRQTAEVLGCAGEASEGEERSPCRPPIDRKDAPAAGHPSRTVVCRRGGVVIGSRKFFIALGGIVISIVACELHSR
jgi:hypothetical protein